MIILNGNIFEDEGLFVKKSVIIKNNKIVDFSSESDASYQDRDEEILDASDMYVIPGLIDIHLHGCDGHDFCEASNDAIKAIADYELKKGISSICPASMTLDEESLINIFKTAAAYDNSTGASLLGINMEGPFLSSKRAGAQNTKYLHKPDLEMFNRLQQAANGLVQIVDIAPEEEGGLDFIEKLSQSVRVSLAHTGADYELSMKAFQKGASQVTHLYNGMEAFHHRKPGLVGAAADSENVFVELITDGIHVDGSIVRASFKLFGDDRIILISDSMEACGKKDGQYMLGGQKVYVCGHKAILEDGTIAGSVTNLMDCLRTAVKVMNIPLESAVKCATVNPARSIRKYDEYGSLEIGKKADLVILNKELEIQYIIKNGNIITSPK